MLVLFVVLAPFLFPTPKQLTVKVKAPSTCKVGESFQIRAKLTDSAGKARTIYSVDVSKKYLGGIVVESVEPYQTGSESALGFATYDMNTAVPPNGELEVILNCKAVQAGDYSGDLQIYVDNKARSSVDNLVRTVVME